MRLRDLLLQTRTLDPTLVARAEAHAAQVQRPLAHVLVRFNVVDSRRLARLLSRALHFELIDVGAIEIHPRLLEVVPRHAAEQLRVLPIGLKVDAHGERLYLAMSDPTDEATIALVEQATGRAVEPLVCDDAVLEASLDKHYGRGGHEAPLLVGALVSPAGTEYLTESTAEALRFVHSLRSAEEISARDIAPLVDDTTATRPVPHPDRMLQAAVDDAPTLSTRRPRPASLALAGIVGEATVDAYRPSETLLEVRGAPSDERLLGAATIPSDENLFDDVTVERRAPASAPAPVELATPRIVVAVNSGAAGARDDVVRELLDLLGPVEIADDDVEACRRARAAQALVLVEPRPRSALLRALLDLEEVEPRPRIIVLGGDPALRMLAFIDHSVDAPVGARAIAVATVVALRHAGVRV